MSTGRLSTSVLASLAVTLFVTGSFAQAKIVHDNFIGDLSIRSNSGTSEIGDEIVLGTGSRIITDPTLHHLWGEGLLGSNAETRLPSFLNDGPDSQTGLQEPLSLSGSLPDTFAWPVTFRGIGEFCEPAGVDLYNPPTVGSKYLEYWENTGSGGSGNRDDSGGTTMNFDPRLAIVPEPGVVALGLIGGLAALVMRNRFKRS